MHKRHGSELIKWGVFLAVAAALFALLWGGWSLLRHRQPNVSAAGPTVAIGLTDAPGSLDIRTDTSKAVERVLIGNVYETLIGLDQNNQLTSDALAKNWSTSADGLTLTLTLRDGLRFSNGDTLDSQDAVWSLQQIITKRWPGAEQLGNITAVSNPDATTVTITLSAPSPALPRALAGRAGIVYDADATIDYAHETAGSGPFTVTELSSNDNGTVAALTMSRSANYWGTKAAAGTVRLTYYADDNALVSALTDSGDIDMILPSDPATATSFAGKDAWTTASGPTTDKVVLAYNTSTDSLLSDEQVRKSIRYLVDASGIAQSQADAWKPLGGPISQLEPGYEDLTGLFPYDVNQGAALLSYFGANYIPSVDLVVSEHDRALGQTIAQQIGQVPLPKVNLEVLGDADYRQRIQDGTWELTITSMDGADSVTDAGAFANPNSMFHYDHTDIQQAWQSALAATNDADYTQRLAAYARMVSKDAASHWLYTRKCALVAATSVSGYPTAMLDQRLPLGSISKH